MFQGVALPNFYQLSKLQNPSNLPKRDDLAAFPQPDNGEFYTSEEIKIKQIDNASLTRIDYPATGGIETYLQYYKYPYKGVPNAQIVGLIGLMKGLIPVASEFIVSMLKNPFTWFSLKKSINRTFPKVLLYAHRLLDEYLPEKETFYCKSVREMYRIFAPEVLIENTITLKKDNPKREERAIWTKIRDLLCLILEFDNAYRFPFQDVVGELNVEKLKKHPIQEIRRLFDLMIGRQVFPHLALKYKKIKFITTILLIISPSLKKKVIEIIGRIDVSQIKPDEGDLYFLATRTDFKYNSLLKVAQ